MRTATVLVFMILALSSNGMAEVKFNKLDGSPIFPSKIEKLADLNDFCFFTAKMTNKESDDLVLTCYWPGQRKLCMELYSKDKMNIYSSVQNVRIDTSEGGAKLSLVEVNLERIPGEEVLQVVNEGEEGSGGLQMIKSWFAWNGKEFKPILCETDNSTSSMATKGYSAVHSIISEDGVQIEVTVDYFHSSPGNNAILETSDVLKWDPNTFCYYSEAQERIGLTSKDPFRRDLAEARLRFFNMKWDLTEYNPGSYGISVP
jgi:hypothetical protein